MRNTSQGLQTTDTLHCNPTSLQTVIINLKFMLLRFFWVSEFQQIVLVCGGHDLHQRYQTYKHHNRLLSTADGMVKIYYKILAWTKQWEKDYSQCQVSTAKGQGHVCCSSILRSRSWYWTVSAVALYIIQEMFTLEGKWVPGTSNRWNIMDIKIVTSLPALLLDINQSPGHRRSWRDVIMDPSTLVLLS